MMQSGETGRIWEKAYVRNTGKNTNLADGQALGEGQRNGAYHRGKLIIIGFGLQQIEYSISRLMAFDAEIIGVWGCLPEYYPIVLNMVLTKKIDIGPFVQTRPMSSIVETFEEIHKSGSPIRRVVLTPDF